MTNDILEALDNDHAKDVLNINKQLDMTEQLLTEQTELARHLGEKVAATDKRLADINAALKSLLDPLIVSAVDDYMAENLDHLVADAADDLIETRLQQSNDDFDISDFADEIAEIADNQISNSDYVSNGALENRLEDLEGDFVAVDADEVRNIVKNVLSAASVSFTMD